jgi:hypothetical protein
MHIIISVIHIKSIFLLLYMKRMLYYYIIKRYYVATGFNATGRKPQDFRSLKPMVCNVEPAICSINVRRKNEAKNYFYWPNTFRRVFFFWRR